MRRWFATGLIAVALAFSGVWWWCYGRDAQALLRGLRQSTTICTFGSDAWWPEFLAPDPAANVVDYPARWTLDLTRDRKKFPKTVEDFRAFAERHPAVEPVELWMWWRNVATQFLHPPTLRLEKTLGAQYPHEPSGYRATEEELAPTPEEAVWDEALAFLRDRDPDNGWPLWLLAHREITRSTREYAVRLPDPEREGATLEHRRYEVVAPDHAARAARLLHEAVRKPRFDCAIDEATLVEFGRMGGRADSLSGTLRQISVFAGMLLPDLGLLRETARRMTGEAERVARTPVGADDSDPLPALAILEDLQTLAARLVARETTLVSGLVGVAMVRIANDEGDRILRDAGRADEAERLLARGRRLFRPWFLSQARSYWMGQQWPDGAYGYRNPPRLTPSIDDPELLAEAKAAAHPVVRPYVAPRDDPEDPRNMGLLVGMLIPGLARAPASEEVAPTIGELRDSRRFEHYGFLRAVVDGIILPLLGVGLALFLAAYGIGLLPRRRAEPDETPPWPGFGWVLRASVVAALLSFAVFGWMSLVAADWVVGTWSLGSLSRAAWSGYWLAWGLLAGWHGLAWMAARGARKACPESARGRAGPGWWRKGAALVVGACFVLSPAAFVLPWPGRADAGLALAFLLLAPPLVAVLFQWVGMVCDGFRPAVARGRGRYLMAGLAGWLLLWGVYAARVHAGEKTWAARDRIIVPDVVGNRFVGFTVTEGRIAERYREHVVKALAEDAARTAATE